LPAIETTRKDAWRYLGFKHVNGPAKWDSYAKAQYVDQVHTEFNVPLEDIARQIGDKHNTVQRLYRALRVVKQAETEGVFRREERAKPHFSFSHLYTGLDYEGIASFLSLRDEAKESNAPVPKSRLKQLGELCRWLYGDRARDEQPVVQSQNPHLRKLDEVLRNKEATEVLRAGLPLNVALEVSYGEEKVFRRSLVQARDGLQKARATLSTGFDGDKELLRVADDIANLAYDLYEEMERKATPRKRRARRDGSA
jgi:hypothetical protein